MSTKYRLPIIFGLNCPTQQSHGPLATAKLLVLISTKESTEDVPKVIASNTRKIVGLTINLIYLL